MTIEREIRFGLDGRDGIHAVAPRDGVRRQETADQRLLELVEQLTDEVTQLRIALESNRRIALAIGMLMEQLHVDDEQVFDMLRRISQHTNRKLRDIAEDVIRHRRLEAARPRSMSQAQGYRSEPLGSWPSRAVRHPAEPDHGLAGRPD